MSQETGLDPRKQRGDKKLLRDHESLLRGCLVEIPIEGGGLAWMCMTAPIIGQGVQRAPPAQAQPHASRWRREGRTGPGSPHLPGRECGEPCALQGLSTRKYSLNIKAVPSTVGDELA